MPTIMSVTAAHNASHPDNPDNPDHAGTSKVQMNVSKAMFLPERSMGIPFGAMCPVNIGRRGAEGK